MRPEVYIVGRDSIPAAWSVPAGESLSVTLVVLPGAGLAAGTSGSADSGLYVSGLAGLGSAGVSGGRVEASLRIDLTGPGASAYVQGLYLCPGAEKVSLSVDVRHLSEGCESRQLLKGVVGGTASFSFHGRILVPEGSQKTKAYQENHSILMSREAVVETSPQLEIYADDVECSHGATVGSLSELEQFYMRSRGIPLEEARRLQILSFLSPVLSGLPSALRDKVLASL